MGGVLKLTENLLVIWQNTKSRQKYHIGTLSYNTVADIYIFTYAYDVEHRGLMEAIKNGFRGIYEFELTNEPKSSNKLFHFFNKRIPNSSRKDYKELLKFFGLAEKHTKMEFLRRTKGKLATDNFELYSPIVRNNLNNTFSLESFIEGWRYYDGDKVFERLRVGDKLKMERDYGNEQDKYAVKILTKDNIHLGYVAGVYSEFLSKVLDSKNYYEVRIKNLLPKAIPQMKVSIEIDGECNFISNNSSVSDTSPKLKKELILI